MQLGKLPSDAPEFEHGLQLQVDTPPDVPRIKVALDPDFARVRVLIRVLRIDIAVLRLAPDADGRLPLQHPFPEVLLLQDGAHLVSYSARPSLGSLERPHPCASVIDIEV